MESGRILSAVVMGLALAAAASPLCSPRFVGTVTAAGRTNPAAGTGKPPRGTSTTARPGGRNGATRREITKRSASRATHSYLMRWRDQRYAAICRERISSAGTGYDCGRRQAGARMGPDAAVLHRCRLRSRQIGESRNAESVLNAIILASYDARHAEFSETTRMAFANAWALQSKTGPDAGSWLWQNFNYTPWEGPGSQYYFAAQMAVAAGMEPGRDKHEELTLSVPGREPKAYATIRSQPLTLRCCSATCAATTRHSLFSTR